MNIEGALKNWDNPIQRFEEDLLQRSGFVEEFYRILSAVSDNESNVFALYGEWGSGKTSVKNLLKLKLETLGDGGFHTIEFNPWEFSGQNHVLEAFFNEVSRAIGKTDAKQAAESFKKLGTYLSYGAKAAKSIHVGLDLFGIPGSKIVGLVGEGLERGAKDTDEYGNLVEAVEPNSLEQIHGELKKTLSTLKKPLLIILDDLDRLTAEQILVIFQIVKLNANLPRVNYLLLMDPKTISGRLEGKGLGAEYIEKIIQFEFTMPHVSDLELKAILRKGFEVVAGNYSDKIDWNRWDEAWHAGCRNLFTTLRRVKRFLHGLKFHINIFASEDVLEVDAVDLFLVETIRRFAPETHNLIPRVFASVVEVDLMQEVVWQLREDDRNQFGKKELTAVLGVAPPSCRDEIDKVLCFLFPQIGSGLQNSQSDIWIRDARICHQTFFLSYFRLAVPRQLLTQQELSEVFKNTGDCNRLSELLSKLYHKVDFTTLCYRIKYHSNKLNASHVRNVLCGLWVLDDVDAKSDGMERGWPSRPTNQSMTVFLLKEFVSETERAALVKEVLDISKNYYAFIRLIDQEIADERAHLLFPKDDLLVLKEKAINCLEDVFNSRQWVEIINGGQLLFMWARLTSNERPRAWVQGIKSDPQKLPVFLSWLIQKNTAYTAPNVSKEHRYIGRAIVESFLELNDELKNTLKLALTNKLPAFQKFAVEEVIQRIDEKKQKKPEPDRD